jgi:ketosteroid isomerase-like protein
MRRARVLVIAVFLLALGCTANVETSTKQPELDLTAERASLLETDRRMSEAYATSEAPLEAIFSNFAPDSPVLAPDIPMVEGWEASRELFEKLEALPGYSLRFTPVSADVGGAADMGYTIGSYHMTLPDDDGNLVAIDGKYLSLWKRQPDGSWKIAVDMFNANGPPVPAG